MSWQERISVKPDVCRGKVCITGTRVMVTAILDNLAKALDAEEILKRYPTLASDDIRAAVRHAADLASVRVVALPKSG